jgi:dienelactone hydrolase
MTPNGLFIKRWYRQMALRLKQMGIMTVLVDGFNPRGRNEICSQDPRVRAIDTETGMKDSLAGLRYLRGQPEIDGDRIFLFTWGAAGGFLAMTRGVPKSVKVSGGFKAAVMFYPRCAGLKHRLDAYAPIQVFIGAKDNWNPPRPCLTLARRKKAGSAPVEVKIYEGAYHDFDHPLPPREISNVNRILGRVVVGGNPKAREDAYRRSAQFLSRFLARQNSSDGSAAVP